MTRDELDLLRAANPVPHCSAYPEHEVSARMAAIVTSDSAPSTAHHARRWLLAGAAAATVLIVAAGSSLLVDTSDHRAGGADHDGATVTCAVSSRGGPAAVHERQRQATAVIATRLAVLGDRSTDKPAARNLAADLSNATVRFTPVHTTQARAAQACQATTSAIRPLVTAPVAVDATAPDSDDPLAALAFAVPTSEDAYSQLSLGQQQQVADAMSHFDCVPRAGYPLGCTSAGGSATVYLLADQLVGNTDTITTAAHAPDAATGTTQWSVQLNFNDTSAARLMTYTSEHHSDSQASTPAGCSAAASTPCADFLAILVDGAVVTTPLIEATISGHLDITDGFTQQSASALAADVTAAAIELHPSS